MHTPWLQIAHEVRTVNAPQFGGELGMGVGDAYLMLSDLISWALHRCKEDRPPSASSLVKGPTAAQQIANGVGWRGDAQQFLEALERLPYEMVEVLPNGAGVRIRGLKRYDHHWRKSYPEAALTWDKLSANGTQPPATPIGAETAPKPRRNRAETAPPDPDPDPDPEVETEAPTPKPPSSAAPPVVDVGEKEIGVCWELLQDNRDRHRLKRETYRPRAFGQWYRDKRHAGRTDAELVAAHERYLESKTIKAVGHPTAVFLSDGICEARLPDPVGDRWARDLKRIAALSSKRDRDKSGPPKPLAELLANVGGPK